jgi:insertion element IS1 protein InsB
VALLSKKKKKRWIWIVIDKKTKQIIAFVIGNRGTKYARKIWKATLCVAKPSFVCTDFWLPYESAIPSEIHIQSKKETCLIESFNAVVRLSLKRFNRKTKCCSKSDEMIEASLRLLFHKWNNTKRKEFMGEI